MVIRYEGFPFLDHVSEGIQLDPDRAILLLFALHSLSYFFEIINLHIQSNNGVYKRKKKYSFPKLVFFRLFRLSRLSLKTSGMCFPAWGKEESLMVPL